MAGTLSYADAVKAFQNASASSAQNVPAVTFAHDWQQNNLDRTTAETLLKVDQALAGTVPALTVTSAYRGDVGAPVKNYNASVGGAEGSQHLYGKAIDLDLSSFTPQQKQAVLNAVMAQPEIKGIGVYDKNLNTLHFDTRAGDRVAWGPDYSAGSLGTVLNGFTKPMLTGWLNGAPTATSASNAMAAGSPIPPLPTPRPSAASSAGAPTLYGSDGLLGGFGARPANTIVPASNNAAPRIGDYMAQALGNANAVAPSTDVAPTRTASSWLPASLQPGGQGFVDNLGGGMSPLHQFSVAEASSIPPGPYGAEAVLRAALSGNPAALQAAMASVMDAAVQKDNIFGVPNFGAIKNNLQSYLDTVQQQAPGAVRSVQTALAKNQALNAVVPDVLRPMLDSAFNALPPLGTGQVAMPNMRPPMPQQAPTAPPPLVAGTTPDPLAPKMASFSPPPSGGNFGAGLDPTQLGTLQSVITAGGADSWLPGVARSLSNLVTSPGSQEAPPSPPQGGGWPSFPPGDNLDVRTIPGAANAATPSYFPPAANAAGLAQLLGRGGSQSTAQSSGPDFGSFFDPTAAMAGSKSPQQMAADQAAQRALTNPTQWAALDGGGGTTLPQPAAWTPPQPPAFNQATSMPLGGNVADFGRGVGSPTYNPGGYGFPPMPAQPAPPSPRITAAGNALLGFGGLPTSTFMPPSPVSPFSTAQLGRVGQLMNYPRSPMAMPPIAAAPTKQVQIGAVGGAAALPTLFPSMDAFTAAAGPVPQNVNWQATLAPDPFAQPGTQNTYVLNDLDAMANSMGQTDSYYNLPAFSWA